jgi:predicted HD phosphohydrolase
VKTVSFTQMSDGTAEDYALLSEIEAAELARFPDRVLSWLRSMDVPSGYRVTRLEHCLQSATRAHRAGEDEETVVCALLHDIGDILAPANHSEAAAALLRPYISERNYWIVRHHGLFQGVYYFHHIGGDPDAREEYRDHPYYQATADFCARYDQNCFDPGYDWEPLEFFGPMVARVLSPARLPAPTDPPTGRPASSRAGAELGKPTA